MSVVIVWRDGDKNGVMSVEYLANNVISVVSVGIESFLGLAVCDGPKGEE